MRKRRTLMKRLMAIVLVVVMIMTSQNLSGLVAAAAGEQVTTLELEAESYVPEVDLPDNDELFAGYVDREFYGETTTYGWLAGNRLENQVAYNLYDFLKTEIEAIANGTNASAVITFDPESLGAEATFENMSSDAAWAEFIAQFDMSLVFDALLHDCPYELYWFDKTTGMSYGCSMSATGSAPTYTTVTIENPYITFAVAGNYQPSSYDSTAPTVDTAITSATSTAVTNAKAIVTAYESLDDYNKLVAYRDKICELVSYDTAAANAGTFSQDNDPWQLIHVFDGDTNTNVVCEGYSKAFQYLCDMTTFKAGIYSYIATGKMTGGTGSGGHMWNIVTMDDGYNYLVDITNSDAGSIGQNGGLFLAGTTGDITNGYTFTIGSTGVRFTYDTDTTGLWGTDTDSILILADSDYVYTPTLDQLRIGEVDIVVEGEVDSAAILPDGVSYDHSTKTITLNNANLELGLENSDNLIQAVGDYTLVLTGDNTIIPVSANASLEEDYVRGIDIDGDLTISGTGSLTIDVSGVNVQYEAYGIRSSGNMVINGGTINVITGDLSDNGTYNKAIEVSGNLTINAGTIHAEVGDALCTEWGYAYGIEVIKNMTVAEGAIVNATAGEGTLHSHGILVNRALTTSGNITASAGKAAEVSVGIYAGIVDINGGKVVAAAGESDASYGIEGTDITINDAYIETQSGRRDIFEYNSIDIDSSVIVSRGQKTVTVYGEAALIDDLEITSEYTFEYDNDATLTLGEYSIVLANGGTISDEALAGITDEAAMVTLADGTNIYYGDIQTALALGMEMAQSTLTLLANVSERLDITSGSGLTIDLNGYEIQTGNEYAVIVNASAKITIKDSSEAKSGKVGTWEFSSGIWNRGKLTLEGILCYGKYYAVSNSGDLYVNDSKLNDGASSFYNQGNVYVSGSSVINYDLSNGGKVYIADNLTDGASIEIKEGSFNVVAYPAEGYTITDSDIAKFEHVNALDGYVIRVNEDGNAQVYGDLAKATLTIVPNGFDYSSEEQSITETVEFMGTILTKDTDYTVEGTSGTNAGEYTVTVTGTGNYVGEITDTYNIEQKVITPQIIIKDKQYDMETDAEIDSVTLDGVVEGDDVSVSWENVTAEFEDANVGNDKSVTLTGELLLTGDDAANYVLDMENVTVTGNIVNNYYAEEGVDYTVNSDGWINGWTNEDIVIKAMDGYKFAIEGMTLSDWMDEVTVSLEGQYNIRLFVKNSEGDVSNRVVVEAKVDKTAPTGIITARGSEFTGLNTIGGFNIFFWGPFEVGIEGMDDNEVQSVEYILSDELLDKLELLSRTDWEAVPGASVSLVDPSEQYVYAKITDIAGNSTYISSTGIVAYSGIELDTTYFGYIKKSDESLDVKVQLNGNTLDKLWLDENGELTEVDEECYEISGDTITIKNTYLDELEAGAYYFGISFNPLGYEYVEAEDNIEPQKKMFDVNIALAEGNVIITNEAELGFTYGEEFVGVQYEADSTGEVTVKYEKLGVGYVEKPVDAGDYIVYVTVAGDMYYAEGSVETAFTVAKADALTIADVKNSFVRTVATTGNTIDISALLPEDRGITSYNVNADIRDVYKNVIVSEDGIVSYDTLTSDGEITDTFIVEVEMENYENTYVTVEISLVEKEVVEITGVQAATGLIYDGTIKQGYTGTPTSKYSGEYVITYAKAGTTISALADVEPIDAGDYTVTIAVPDDDLYHMGSVTLEFSIGKATPVADDVTMTLPTNAEYDGEAKEVAVEATNDEIGEVTVYYHVDGQWTTDGPVNVGTYDVAVDIAESGNYKSASKLVVGKLQITPKDIAGAVVTLDESELVYAGGETLIQLVDGVVIDGLKVTYDVTGNEATDAGAYELTITGKGNFTGTVKAEWSIEKAIIKVTVSDITKVYGDADPELTYKVEGIIGNVSLDIPLEREQGETVGEYDIVLGDFSHKNYDAEYVGATFTITAKDIADAVVTLGNALTYSGTAQTQSIVSVVVDGVTLAASDYEVTGNVGTNAGDYSLTITGKGNYKGTATAQWTIAKKEVKITADAVTKTYGDADPTLTSVVSGLVAGDEVKVTLERVAGENVGEYDITLKEFIGDNYETEYVGAKLTITAKDITGAVVKLDESKLIYDGTEQTQNVVSVVLDGATLTADDYVVSKNVGTYAGDYELTVTGKGNYEGSVTAAWSIVKKPLSIKTASLTKVYGDADPEFTYAIEGLVEGDNVNVSLKREEGENVGEYDITLDSFKADNYDMTFTDGVLTITAKDIAGAVVTLGDKLTYNGAAQTQSVVSVVVDGVTLAASDYEVTGNVGTNAGDYTLTITGKGNYKGTATAEWSIAKKDIADAAITLDETELVYDGTEQTQNVVSVVVDGVTLEVYEYEVTGNVGTVAGDYELTVTITGRSNYTGAAKAEWSIAPMEITDIEVTVDEDETFVYDGTEQTKEVIEVVINGEALDESEYEVVGNVQKDSGEHVIIVSLKGNYSGTVDIPWTINKADNVSDVEANVLPKESNEVSNDVEKLGDIELPEGWVWSEEDADITLEPGKEITATAVYVGEDKDNYENTTMTVKITRAEKDSSSEDEKNPYTGDSRNAMIWLYVLLISGLYTVAFAGSKKRKTE